MLTLDDTIAAIATPLGEGGMGVIRISGPAAVNVASAFFHLHEEDTLLTAAPRTCHLGRIAEGRSLDHAIATVFRAPQSYTGDDVVELSVHGSPYILQEVLSLCLSHGARMALPGEFTQRAFLNGKLDLAQAEAVCDLIHARTEAAHAAAFGQLEGTLSREVRRLRDQLVPLLAHIEVGLDHSDEDHDFLQAAQLRERSTQVLEAIDGILQSARTGKILREGLRVTLVGRPNVGKSSLLNALLREDRAIVTPVAGTTRDTLEESANWDGLPVVLTDTAGLRSQSHDPVERLGMDRTRKSLEASDVVIGLFDASEPLTAEDEAVIQSCAYRPHLWALNKSDLTAQSTPEDLSRYNGSAPTVHLSALTGKGIPELIQQVKRLALGDWEPRAQAEWILNQRHAAALQRAREALLRAQEASDTSVPEECVALELKTALQALGEIIGETTTEDLLGEIFSQFCVGK